MWSDGTVTSGTAEIHIEKDTGGGYADLWGTAGSGAMQINSTNDGNDATTASKGTYTFDAGDKLRIRWDSSSLDTARDIGFMIGVEC